MYRRISEVGAALLLVGMATACVSHSSAKTNAGQRTKQASWSGSIKPATRTTGTVEASAKVMYDGTVIMRQDTRDTTRSKIDMLVSAPTGNASVSWALVPGRCRSGGVPVLPVNNFQPIDIGSSGRAEMSVSIPFGFPNQGTYHIDIYSGNRATLSDVVACADLKFAK